MVIKVNEIDLGLSNMQNSDKRHTAENPFFITGKSKKFNSDESYMYIVKVPEGMEFQGLNFKIINEKTDSVNSEYAASLNDLIQKRAMKKKFAQR